LSVGLECIRKIDREARVVARLEGGVEQSSGLPTHLDPLAEAARSRLVDPASSPASSSAAHRRSHLDWTSACGYTAALQDESARYSLNAAIPTSDNTGHRGGILKVTVTEASSVSGGEAGKGLRRLPTALDADVGSFLVRNTLAEFLHSSTPAYDASSATPTTTHLSLVPHPEISHDSDADPREQVCV